MKHRQADLVLLRLCCTLWIVFFCHCDALNLVCSFSYNTLTDSFLKTDPPPVIPTLHQWLSNLCQSDTGVASISFQQTSPVAV